MLGKAAVGKSCLSVRYSRGLYNEEYNPTLQDIFTEKYSIKGYEGNLGTYLDITLRDTGHGGLGGVYRHAGTLDQRRPGLHPGLLHHRPRVLLRDLPDPLSHRLSAAAAQDAHHHSGQQVRPGVIAGGADQHGGIVLCREEIPAHRVFCQGRHQLQGGV